MNKRKVDAHSSNNSWRGRAKIIIYPECVSVTLVILHVTCVLHFILSSVFCLALLYATTLFQKHHDLGEEKSIEESMCVDKKNQLDVTFCILYFSSNSCSTCFGQPCAHHQKLTTA